MVEYSFLQDGMFAISPPHFCPCQIRHVQQGSAQISSTQNGLTQVHPSQIDAVEFLPAEIRPARRISACKETRMGSENTWKVRLVDRYHRLPDHMPSDDIIGRDARRYQQHKSCRL
jgi:hypothetical protein